jgi:hypothetical protein
MISRMKKAASFRLTAPAEGIQKEVYRGHRLPSSPFCRTAASNDAASLGLLLLLLSISANGLNPSQARAGWILVERWAEKYIETKHRQEAA